MKLSKQQLEKLDKEDLVDIIMQLQEETLVIPQYTPNGTIPLEDSSGFPFVDPLRPTWTCDNSLNN